MKTPLTPSEKKIELTTFLVFLTLNPWSFLVLLIIAIYVRRTLLQAIRLIIYTICTKSSYTFQLRYLTVFRWL